MIEINLVPDVKQELIKARRIRTIVVSSAIIVGVVSIAVVALLAMYLFGVQSLRSSEADRIITEKSKQLSSIEDLSNALTIQHQLTKISQLHDQKNIDSRLFELLVALNPVEPNQVNFSLAKVDAEEKTINLEGQAQNGFTAADAIKKTILGTSLSYKDGDATKTVPLTKSVTMSDLSYGESVTGEKVLRFTLSFEYNEAFFARTSENAVILRPDKQNATDSFRRLPDSLFVDRASDTGGNN